MKYIQIQYYKYAGIQTFIWLSRYEALESHREAVEERVAIESMVIELAPSGRTKLLASWKAAPEPKKKGKNKK